MPGVPHKHGDARRARELQQARDQTGMGNDSGESLPLMRVAGVRVSVRTLVQRLGRLHPGAVASRQSRRAAEVECPVGC